MICREKERIKSNQFYKSININTISLLPKIYTDVSFKHGEACSAFYIPSISYYKRQAFQCSIPFEGELNAILFALNEYKSYKGTLHFYVDNPQVVKCLNKHGWFVHNYFPMRDWISRLYYPQTHLIQEVKKYPPHVVTFVKSHNGEQSNQAVDSIAKEGLYQIFAYKRWKFIQQIKSKQAFPSIMK